MLTSRLFEFQVNYFNPHEYRILKREIFTQHSYYFETDQENPIVVDVGAHYGLATLYFKHLYPAAKIIAVEPHPAAAELFLTNIHQNGLTDITLIQKAINLTDEPTTLFFDQSNDQWLSNASLLPQGWNHRQIDNASLTVPSLTLKELFAPIIGPIDFLKIDIEGIESEILLQSGGALKQVKQIAVEYHPQPKQEIKKLIEYLESQKFAIEVEDQAEQRTKLITGIKESGLT